MTAATAPLVLRALRFPLVRLLLLGGIPFVGLGVSNGFRAQFADRPLVALACVLSMVALAIHVGLARFVERRPVRERSLPGMGREPGAGLLMGLGLHATCIVILMTRGIYPIDGINPLTLPLPMLPMSIRSGILAELLHRGVLSIAVEAGVLLAAAFMLTRRLWLAMGFHMSWTYAQAAIVSGAVSGVEMPPGLIVPMIAGPDLLTGGRFGVEASMVAFLLCTAAGVILLGMAVRRGHVVVPIWALIWAPIWARG